MSNASSAYANTWAVAARPAIRPATTSDGAEVLAALTSAFHDDPAARALYPKALAFQKYFPRFAEAFSGAVFSHGVVDRTADWLGVALWLPPGVEPDPTPVIAHLEATVAPARVAAIMAGLEAQGALHPHEPHWYLPFIGVRPEGQGRGLGAHLLEHGLRRADADAMPAYLEATSARSVRLYRRHGFEVIGEVNSPDYPQIFAMWRPAWASSSRSRRPVKAATGRGAGNAAEVQSGAIL